MEQIKAERSIWHKNCFKCEECGKQLNVDTYQSHEGAVYCKPHFKSLFAPKVVEDEEPRKSVSLFVDGCMCVCKFRMSKLEIRPWNNCFKIAEHPKKHELIIRENQPQELPPDVVRGIFQCLKNS